MLRRPYSLRISKTPTSSHFRISSVSQQLSLKRRPWLQLRVVSNRQLKRLCMALQICSTVIGNLENGPKLITKQVKNLVKERRPAKNQDKERLEDPHKIKRIKMRCYSKGNRHIISVTTGKSILTKLYSRVKKKQLNLMVGLHKLSLLRERSHTRCGNRVLLRSPIPLFSMRIRK